MRKALAISALAVGTALASGLVQADGPAKCAARTDLAGACYQVRGRLSSYEGGPSTEKIWVIGTKRVLGVYDRATHKATMPKSIKEQLDDYRTQVFADYRVCPLEKESARHQGYVCIESAGNIRVERHQTVHGRHYAATVHIPDTAPDSLVD